MFEGMPRTIAEYWEVLPGPRDVCYSQGMTDNEITPVYTHTTAQVLAAVAQAMSAAAAAVQDVNDIDEAKAILWARAQGAEALIVQSSPAF